MPEAYEKIAKVLQEEILHGKYAVGSPLPDHEQLCMRFRIGRTVIDRALRILIAGGWVDLSNHVLNPPSRQPSSDRRQAGRSLSLPNDDRVSEVRIAAERIVTDIRDGIKNGKYPAGTVFVREILMADFGAGRRAVASAMKQLQDDDLLVSRTCAGTRVATKCDALFKNKPPDVRLGPYIEGILRDRLADGTYPPESSVPSAPALAEEFGVSLAVINEALAPLKEKRLLVRRKGGYVVNPRVEELLGEQRDDDV